MSGSLFRLPKGHFLALTALCMASLVAANPEATACRSRYGLCSLRRKPIGIPHDAH